MNDPTGRRTKRPKQSCDQLEEEQSPIWIGWSRSRGTQVQPKCREQGAGAKKSEDLGRILSHWASQARGNLVLILNLL